MNSEYSILKELGKKNTNAWRKANSTSNFSQELYPSVCFWGERRGMEREAFLPPVKYLCRKKSCYILLRDFIQRIFSPQISHANCAVLRKLGFVDTKEVNKKLSCLDLPLIDMALFPGETTQPLSSLHFTFYRKLK